MPVAFAEIAFTPSVRAAQERHGSAAVYGRLLSEKRSGGDRLTARERDFLEERDGFYQATVSETGWPYVQFRGGAKGFLRALDDRTLAYADLRGNRQYVSVGNLSSDDRVSLIAIDYTTAHRLKVWGRAAFAAPDETEAAGGAERRVLIRVEAFDWNCPSHIPRRYTPEEAGGAFAALERENAALRAELAGLRRTARTQDAAVTAPRSAG